MEGILLDTMFDLPSLEGVEEVVISREVVEGTAALRLRCSHQRRRRERVVGRAWSLGYFEALEVRQDLVTDEAGQRMWAALFVRLLPQAYQRLIGLQVSK
jgi:hypothetical protein